MEGGVLHGALNLDRLDPTATAGAVATAAGTEVAGGLSHVSSSFWSTLRRSRKSARHLDIEESDVLGVALDERPTLLDVLAHQHREDLVGPGGVVEGHLQHQPLLG